MKTERYEGAESEIGAVLSDDRTRRFMLWRTWDVENPRRMGFIMLNPSVADAEVDDPTIRRCIGFGKREGAGGIIVCNLVPIISTDPAGLKVGLTTDDLERNALHLFDMAERVECIVVAWGAGAMNHGVNYLADRVKRQVGRRPLYALGLTKDGHPRHPLYVRSDKPLEFIA